MKGPGLIRKIANQCLRYKYTFFDQRKNIVMFHLGRCGSTALSHHLQQHPQIKWAGEIIEHETEKDAALHKINVFATNSFRRYSGIEIKPFHLRNCQISTQEFLNYLTDKHFSKIIFLTRKNLLRQLISSLIGGQTRMWHIKESDHQKLHQIMLDPNAVTIRGQSHPLFETLQQIEKDILDFEAYLQDSNILRLYYEDDVSSSPAIGYQKICAYLGIPHIHNTISLLKTNPYPIKEILLNFSEVEAALKDTRFEWMLYDEA